MRREGEGKVGKRGRGGTDPISEITLVSAGASPDVVVVSEDTGPGPLTSGVAFRILGQLEFVDDNFAKAAVCFHFTSDPLRRGPIRKHILATRNSHHLSLRLRCALSL